MSPIIRKISYSICIIAILSFLAGCATTTIRFNRLQPPVYDIPAGKRLAIVDFSSPQYAPDSGRAFAGAIVAALMPTQFYELVERTQIQNVVREIKFGSMEYVEPSTAQRLGQLLGADYVIVGEVTAFDVEDEVGYREVPEQVWTGGYYYDEFGYRHRMYRTVMRSIEVRTRRGTVSAAFRLVVVETGNILASDQLTRTFCKSSEGAHNLPAREEILSGLTQEIVDFFVKKIAPYAVSERRSLEYGKHPLTRKGVRLAKNGLWREAVESWNEARSYSPDEASIYHNLGIAAEIKGDLDAAETLYKKALELVPDKKRYMENIRRIRHLQKIYENHPESMPRE